MPPGHYPSAGPALPADSRDGPAPPTAHRDYCLVSNEHRLTNETNHRVNERNSFERDPGNQGVVRPDH
jgi:hypothetical protein